MKDENYEIVQSDELEYLRHEVEKLKRNPLGDTQASIGLLDSMNKLNDNIEKLIGIFQSANDEMVKTFNDESYQEQLRKIRSENAKIAHGIVAVAELVKKFEKEQKEVLPTFEEFIKTAKDEMLKEHQEQKVFPSQPPAPAVQQPEFHFEAPSEGEDPNPFESSAQPQFRPIVDQPLPHPGMPGVPGAEPVPGVASPGVASPDMPQPPQAEKKEDEPIPTDEIPPPPPKGL